MQFTSILSLLPFVLMNALTAEAFWDLETTTTAPVYEDYRDRTSMFRYQMTINDGFFSWARYGWRFVYLDENSRRLLGTIAGISIDLKTLGTGAILNRRNVLTAANLLDPYMGRQEDLKVWAAGRAGEYNTPWRYRVWRVHRVLPRSLNPEHWHGARGEHCPRHDLAVVQTRDAIYLHDGTIYQGRYFYADRLVLAGKYEVMPECHKPAAITAPLGCMMEFGGSGYESLNHIRDNYKIVYSHFLRDRDVVDCSLYLPKWWGKFICMKNYRRYSGISNGGALFSSERKVFGIGSFEIRYNEDRIIAFTDVRYYVDPILLAANLSVGEYYEYAVVEWNIDSLNTIFYGWGRTWMKQTRLLNKDLFPVGKK